MDWNTAYESLQATHPDDFEKWQDLIELAEGLEGGLNKTSSGDALEKFRTSYDKLLERFPMLQGFWARYAEWEFKLGDNNRTLQVYERAVSFLPGCVDLWRRYCSFKALITANDVDSVRLLFQRAADKVGAHFLSHDFWDAWVGFEQRYGGNQAVFDVLFRAAQQPLHQYAKFYQQMCKVAKLLPPGSTAPEWKVIQFRAEYEIDREEGQVNQNISPDYDLRVRIENYYREIYEHTQWQVSKRWQYESAIKRHHFDVEYLPESELVTWRKYLMFERIEQSPNVELLYERAVVPTALHEEIWLQYARYLMSIKNTEDARSVLNRACAVVPQGRVQVRLLYGKFLESLGEVEAAQGLYESVLEVLPGCVEVCMHLGGLLLRNESPEKVTELYKRQIASASDEEAGFLIAKYAQVQLLTSMDKARAVYEQYTPMMSTSFIFWREYLKFEIDHGTPELVARVFEEIKEGQLHQRQIKDLGHYYMDYCLTSARGSNINEYFAVDRAVHKSAALTL